MSPTEPFTDIHCHLLPGLDDGAATLEDALAMAEMAVADGLKTIVATPHQLGNHPNNSAENIRAAVARFQRHLDQRRIALRVLPGADVRIEPDLVRKIRNDEVLTLGDHRRHILLELPHDVYVPLDRVLAELRSAGIVGILSHPERNQGIRQQPNVLSGLIKSGCLMQVTAGSLLGNFGRESKQLSEWMIEEGLVHIISTDAHNISSRSPRLGQAFRRVAELASIDAAVQLCCRNPASVAEGRGVDGKTSQTTKSTFLSRVRHLVFFAPSKPQRRIA